MPAATRWLLVACVLAGTWGGCRTAPRVEGLPGGLALPMDDERAIRAVADYRAGLGRREGLRGSARVALSGVDFELNRPQRIVVERPARLRFEVLGLFEQPAAILATDGSGFDFYEAETGQVSRGRVSASLLWDLAKIDLSPEEVVGLLLATPVPPSGTLPAGVWLEPEGRVAVAFAWPNAHASAACSADDPWIALGAADPDCRLTSRDLVRGGGQLFFFDEVGTLREVRGLEEGGELRYRALFDRHAPIAVPASGETTAFPRRITLEFPAVGSRARFDWKRIMLARGLPDGLFRLPELR